ncbi:MAG: hypothetical protein FWC46_01615 [Actinomycetia bacterium]|nr:hypothetical protein [Actinomycetes bacterium]
MRGGTGAWILAVVFFASGATMLKRASAPGAVRRVGFGYFMLLLGVLVCLYWIVDGWGAGG